MRSVKETQSEDKNNLFSEYQKQQQEYQKQ
jgi:hypothetical protein